MPRQGPIDGRKMKPGYLPYDWNPGSKSKYQYSAYDTATEDEIAVVVTKPMEVISVGYVVTVDGNGVNDNGDIKFGLKRNGTSDDDYFVASVAISKDVKKGERYTTHGPRAGNGKLTWASTADTIGKRRLTAGDIITFSKNTYGAGSAYIIPIVLLRPTGERDEDVE